MCGMRILPVLVALSLATPLVHTTSAHATAARAATTRAAKLGWRPVVPFIEDDFGRALALAKKRRLPVFIEGWAPW